MGPWGIAVALGTSHDGNTAAITLIDGNSNTGLGILSQVFKKPPSFQIEKPIKPLLTFYSLQGHASLRI